MPQIDFKPPHSLKEALQRFSLELACMMVLLRNEAHHHDNSDQTVLDVGFLVASLLEDSCEETTKLLDELERRVSGADLA